MAYKRPVWLWRRRFGTIVSGDPGARMALDVWREKPEREGQKPVSS